MPLLRELLFLIIRLSFIRTITQTGEYIPQFVTPVVEHLLERETAHQEDLIGGPTALRMSYVPLP